MTQARPDTDGSSAAGEGDRKVAVVTGASAGVGRATVRLLAERGYDVALLARGRAALDAAAAEVAALGGRALVLPTDVAVAAQVDQAARRAADELGEIDLWVNAAFAGALAYSWDLAGEDFRRITEVTYYGQVHGTLAALEQMRPRDRGVIVNVGSAMAHRSIPLQAAYCGAKHAIKGFTESVITELGHEKSGVRVCMVQLPGLNTPQFNWNLNQLPDHPQPVPPVYQPEVAARAIAHLAEHPRPRMWVGLPTVYTILGERLAPRFADWYLARTGVGSQQTGDTLPDWGSNLREPRDDEVDRGARGPFSDRAHDRDPVSWASRHRGSLLGAGALAAGVAAGARVALGRLAGGRDSAGDGR